MCWAIGLGLCLRVVDGCVGLGGLCACLFGYCVVWWFCGLV